MYHNDNPEVIQGSDIIGLLETKLERVGERVFAYLHVELNPTKTYNDAGHHLHVTDGVNPRMLRVSDWQAAEQTEPPSELPAAEPELSEAEMHERSLSQEKEAEKQRPPSLSPKSMEEGLATEHVRIGSVRTHSKASESKSK